MNREEGASKLPLLDQVLPTFDFHEVHKVTVQAPPIRIFNTIKAVELRQVPLFRTLFALRALPGRLRRSGIPRFDPHEPLFRWACRSGFILLAEAPDQELVLGLVGQPWRLTGGAPPMTLTGQEFIVFRTPGYVKIAANFRLEPEARSRSVCVSTETRIWATDPASRARFSRYWRWIRPGSGLIRREWLRAIKRSAETAADAA